MSVMVAGPHQVSRSPTNNSPTKQLFSFQKAERFQTTKKWTNNLYYKHQDFFNQARNSNRNKTTFGASSRPHLWINKENVQRQGPKYELGTAFRKHL